MVTHGNIVANCRQISAAIDLTEGSRFLTILPTILACDAVLSSALSSWDGATQSVSMRCVAQPRVAD